MNSIHFANNADTLTTASITAETSVIPVLDKSTSVFPKIDKSKNQYFNLVIMDAVDQQKFEYVKCVDFTDTSFTVVRGQEGTAGQSFQKGARIMHTLTAESIYDVQEQARLVRTHADATSKYGSGTAQYYGHVKLTDNFELGTQAINGIICTPNALHQAVNRLLKLPKEQFFTSSTTWICPESGTYTVTCVGGGGAGGAGGYGSFVVCNDGNIRAHTTGGAGGGGGAGETITTVLTLNKGATIQVIVGGGGGATSFGPYITARAGGSGGSGGNSGGVHGNCSSIFAGYGGALGTNYGYGGSAGASGTTTRGNECIPQTYPSAGGAGSTSIQGQYGNGGSGGSGQYNTQECKESYRGPYTGSGGTQGCVKIVYPLGK